MGSVDTSISDLVTIIVKAPNQQIADQTIKCHVNWTIKKLKDYLSEVYPSKPKMEEQKLIYSGKLLTDSAVLKDILRTYEGQENHTVHLVCTSKAQKMNKMPTSSNSSNSARITNPPRVTPSSDLYRNISQPQVNQNTTTYPGGGIPMGTPHPTFVDQMNTNNFSPNNFDPRYVWPTSTAFINVNDAQTNQQFTYMQQVYAQYVSHYMQMMGQSGFGYLASHMPQPISRASQTSPVPNANVTPQGRVNPEVNQNRDNRPAVAAMGNDADEEDGRLNRDWLDWFYIFGRLVILFTIVYFYSTPLRLLAVLLLICMFYLHQNLRLQTDNLNLNNNNNNNDVINHNNNNQNNENRAPPENQETNGLRHRRPNETNATPDATTPAEQPATPTETVTAPIQERLSPFAVTLLMIRSFFLSLVPDQPAL